MLNTVSSPFFFSAPLNILAPFALSLCRLIPVLMLCLWASSFASAQGASVLETQVRSVLDEFHDQYGFPGATAAFVLPDGSVGAAATGFADVEAGREMTPNTPMLAASTGKTFVAATVLALESDGRLSQHDHLADYLGDRAWFAGLPNGNDITIAQLLRHQSGLPDHTSIPTFATAVTERIAADEAAFMPEEVVSFVLGQDALFEAGAGWAYSDTGYILLGLIIEQVTGRDYYEVVDETFLGPLGLNDTIPSNRRDIPELAVGYTVPDNPFGLPERTADAGGQLVWDPAMEWTGGGLASTSRDLARWGNLLYGGNALPVPYLDQLLDGVSVAPDATDDSYGAGVSISTNTPYGPVYGHGGWIPGYISSLRYYADYGVTIAFQINTDVGLVDNSSDLAPALEAELADLINGTIR